jgi:hypothetical protein
MARRCAGSGCRGGRGGVAGRPGGGGVLWGGIDGRGRCCGRERGGPVLCCCGKICDLSGNEGGGIRLSKKFS